MERTNAMCASIKPVFEDVELVGSVLTVKESPGCNLMTHKAIEQAKQGDVVVVDGSGSINVNIIGYIMASAAKEKGVVGMVIDGAVRDTVDLRRIRFPVFCRGIVPAGSNKHLPGNVNVPVNCGRVVVNPGDIIVGDDDGLVVVPKGKAQDIYERTVKIKKKEEKIIKAIKKGKSTVELLNLNKRISDLRIQIE